MRDIVVSTLEELVKGSNLETQKIFTVLNQREDVVVNETQSTICNEQELSRGTNCESRKDGRINSGSNQESERVNEENIQVSTEITTRSNEKVYVLTHLGKSFVNTIVDHACAEKVSELALNGEDRIGDFPYPNIGLTKIVNCSRKSFFNTDARIIDNDELLSYGIEYSLFEDENGEIIETLDAEEFRIVWQQILRASKKVDNVNVSTKLTKPVLYWDNMSCAFDENGKLMKIVGKTTSQDDRYMAQLLQATWNIENNIFLEADRRVTDNKDLLLEFLTRVQNSTGNSGNKGGKSNNKGKNNPRFSKFKQSQPQPENNDKANALNPNQQGEGTNN